MPEAKISQHSGQRPTPTLRVTWGGEAMPASREFASSLRIGRADECELVIKNEHVSRRHAEIALEDGQWWLRDLNSANGIFVNGGKVSQAPVGKSLRFRLGVAGPELSAETIEPRPPAPTLQQGSAAGQTEGDKTILARYVKHYFEKPGAQDDAGEHTMFVRRAAAAIQAKQSRNYRWLIVALALVILAAGGYALYVRRQLVEQRSAAQELFYNMKALDVDIGTLQRLIQGSAAPGVGVAELDKQRQRRRELEQSYNRFLATLKVYDPKLTEKQKLILRVARIFGECELDMPKDFEAEIDKYIQRWQATGRLKEGVVKARALGYTKQISEELLLQGLPPQFFYLVLQESGFDAYASGPMTAKGIAKGAWQFIPETALKYGLRLGPLVDLRRPDPGDDRHHFDRETKAAVRYLKDLYCTDAQASGFLVMASYNWGEGRVLPLIRQMPENPRERNFWRLLAKYKGRMPQETYDYVFYIVSAAVIGEDPRRFGFDFDNPLAGE